jgi:hypothetical protein
MDESPRRSTDRFEDARNQANRQAADLLADEVLAGFQKLAQAKPVAQVPDRAA